MGKSGDLKIWMIDDNQIDKIVDTYIDYVTNPYHQYRQSNDWSYKKISSDLKNIDCPPEKRALKYDDSYKAQREFGDNLPIQIMNLPKPNKIKIKQHFIWLLHQMYLAYINSKNGFFYLNAQSLQSVQKYYNYMLSVLLKTGLFYYNRESQGSFARNLYSINEPKKFKLKTYNNFIVKNDIKKIIEIIEKYQKKQLEEVKRRTSDKFVRDYNKSLTKYKLLDKNAAKKYVENELKNITKKDLHHSKLYHYNIIDKHEEIIKKIIRIDDNNRIYHIITRTPIQLRKFTNITSIIDVRNSHPFLFNYFILEYYTNINNIDINNNNYKSINNKYYYIINNFIFNEYNLTIPYHYFMQCLCKHLHDNNIPNNIIENIKKIKDDVFQYMYSTSMGKMWDEMLSNYPEFSRDEIKKLMFKSVFYSKSKNIYKKQTYAFDFKKKYPTVIKILRHYRTTYINQCTERNITKIKNGENIPKIQIAHKMMQIESYLFIRILKQLFKIKNAYVVGIHDAIAIIDDSIQEEKVKEIIEKQFKEIGLRPSLKCENIYQHNETLYDFDDDDYVNI